MKQFLPFVFCLFFGLSASGQIAAITGSPMLCEGGGTTLSDATPGGAWSTSDPTIATVGASSGIVAGIAAGVVNITYTVGTGYVIAPVTVNTPPTAYLISGGGTACGGPGFHIILSGSDAGVTYQLMVGSTLVGMPIAGTGLSLDFGLLAVSGSYTVVGTNSTTSCQNNMTGTATIVANPLPTPYNMIGSGSYCAGGPGGHISLDGSDPGVTYQLLLGGVPTGVPVPGYGLGIDLGIVTVTGVYTVKATNTATSCTNIMSGSTTVAVNPLPAAYTVTGGGTGCAGVGFLVGLSGSDPGVNYSLQYSVTGIPGSFVPAGITLPGTGLALSFGLRINAGFYFVKGQNSTTGCGANMTGNATITNTPSPIAIAGPSAVCVGATVSLTNTVSGGTWTSSTPSIASVNSATGLVTGIALGTATITYCLSTGCCVSKTVTVSPSPTAIIGSSSLCVGGTIALTETVPGGVWSSTGIIASADPLTGLVNGITMGTATITYSLGTGCFVTKVVTVNSLPVAFTVTGGGNYCSGGLGLHIGLSGSEAGISYSLHHGTTVVGAPIAGTGVPIDFGLFTAPGPFTVVGNGTVTGCSRNMTGSASITVNPSVPPISGPSSVCMGTPVVFSDGYTSGSWSSSNPAIANVGPLSGLLTGVAIGSATISYIAISGCFASVTVNVLSGICTLTPVGGTANASIPTTCAGNSETISLSGASVGCSIGYQWQNSPDGTTFTDIAGASSISELLVFRILRCGCFKEHPQVGIREYGICFV